MRCAAIILAAGKASRYGSPKQLLEIDGRNLVQRACDLAITTQCSPIILVLGAYSKDIIASGIPNQVQVYEHQEWQQGMGSSLALGIQQLDSCDAALILLADQPAISVDTIKSLKQAIVAPDISIALCAHEDSTEKATIKGPPVIFDAKHFPECSELTGDEGGKQIIKRHQSSVAVVSTYEAKWDIDEPDVWNKFPH